ncbi:MAG: transglutaminase domain-containing protein [Bacteroidota bacterium]
MLKHFYLTTLYLFLFSITASAKVDTTVGIKAPKSVSRDYKKLAHHLCDTLDGDFLKANAIYNWITHNIKYDVEAMKRGDLKRPSIKEILKKKKALCDGYADLFSDMSNEIGVKALTISGYARDWMFDDSDKFYTPRHAWNAVYIANNWYLVDATWGAGVIGQFPNKIQKTMKNAAKNPAQQVGKLKFKFKYDADWFMMPPAEFRLKHLPYDPIWQLTDSLMPLSIFEAGEIQIAKFNETYGRKGISTKEVNRFSNLPEHTKVIEEAERAYKYNPRFHVSMAMQHQANAIDSIAILDKNSPPAIRDAVIEKVKQELKSAEKYVALQKESISTEYTQLKKKNKKKNTAAKAYISGVNNNNKQAITKCKSKINSSDNKYKKLQQKAGDAVAAHKKVKPKEFETIKTIAPEDKSNNPRLVTLEDSVMVRLNRLDAKHTELIREHQFVDKLIEANNGRLDTLVHYLSLADSAMIQETIGRINLHDNYDIQVKKWSAIYKEARTQNADSIQKRYFADYDSILVHYETLRNSYSKYLDLYYKNFKDLEQYKRRNRSNAKFLSQYEEQLKTYTSAYEAQQKLIMDYASYLKGNKGLMESLVKHYEHQQKLADYMEKSEEQRQKLEETALTKKEAFDKKENKHQKEILEDAGTRAERFINKKDKS